MKYDLVIAHRVCPVLAKTAAVFTDKFEMVKVTAASLAKAITGFKVKLVVIFDGCPKEYEQLFNETFGGEGVANVDYSCISTPSIGNNATYARQLEILFSATSETKYLYFSEDDYIYYSTEMDSLNRELKCLKRQINNNLY